MPLRNCTLKDIALQCGVSSALVSSVLNGKTGTMKCSAAKRELILKTAGEMDYHPNILARSIKKSQVPIVGVFLKRSASQPPHVLGRSVSAYLGTMTSVLNPMDHEVLFVPYNNAGEQYDRMKSLIARGLLGGIITNIDFQDNLRICELLQHSRLPYLVLGKPALPGTHCIYSSDKVLEELCAQRAAEKGCSRCISVEPGGEGGLIFRAMPFPENHIWAAPALPIQEIAESLDDTLIVFMGCVLVEKLYALGLRPRHYVCVDPADDMEKLAGLHDTFFLQRTSVIENYLRTVFAPWLLNDSEPDKNSAATVTNELNFIFKARYDS